MSHTPATRTPTCPECELADAIRRVVDPTLDATHRCGRCGRSFTHGRVSV